MKKIQGFGGEEGRGGTTIGAGGRGIRHPQPFSNFSFFFCFDPSPNF